MRKTLLLCIMMSLVALNAMAQGLLPVTVQQFLNEQKYSPQFKKMLEANGESSRFFPPREVDGTMVVDAFVAFDNDYTVTLLQGMGVIVNSMFDGFIAAQIPVNRLAEVSRLPGVKDVEISQKLKLCTDSTLSVTHAGQVIHGLAPGITHSYDGSGVIVGVIDVGFDFNHRAFRSNKNTSQTRIARVYNTQVTTGHKAMYNKIIRLPGSVFLKNEISSLTSDNTSATHGTHTACIAAGSHVNGYGGMAPGADIVLCAVSVLDGSLSTVEIANCIRYIDSYADSVGQPYVVSMSVSTPNGQHDGFDYLSRIIKQMMGPGKLFVISAGNNAGARPYSHHLASPSSPFNVMFKYKNNLGDSTYYYGGIIADFWMRSENTNYYYKFHVIDLNTGNIVWESEQLSQTTTLDASELGGFYDCYTPADTVGYIEATVSYTTEGKKYRLDVSLHNLISHRYTLVNGEKRSRYALGMSVYPRKDVPGEIDGWSCNSGSRFGSYDGVVKTMDGKLVSNFYAAPSDSCCIGSFAVGDSTISAGAFAARNSYFSLPRQSIVIDNTCVVGEIAAFSSYEIAGAGPTGKALPTICAPGVNVVSAVSRYSYFARNSPYTVMREDGSYWGVMTGTSMSAPTIAGIIALWLQANPNLSVAEVKDILSRTAIRDQYTTGPNGEHFGPNGKIDALAGLRLVLERLLPMRGDVNGDGFVNISDVTLLIDFILGKDPKNVNLYAADVNGDGEINISDIVLLIDKILGVA